ncbi:hypothetical protein AYL99_00159 [Fonsecaea erecta]|uniref:Xylanolytic transcriptional activator regulatory domain-containing protein n=1 Tax=Fonsecaea erecta TaxID=1367422 RepID=A0A178ZWW5_9EURO|nr:hypothetical protein AYL99_00159 [Fonsecaea erecta]OAP64187.1 hypothetical protein AYL99_00159 [Fonsecaea erecta]
MAVCPFAPAPLLQKLGHNNAQDAQQLCYGRVRHLIHCDVESDPINRLQALLLMTQSTEVRDGARDCCFWSGTALAYAESLDLLKIVRAAKDAEDKAFLHRLWCCCFVSETIFAFSRRRLPKMRIAVESEHILQSHEFNDQEAFRSLVRSMSHIHDMLSIKHAAPCPSSHHDTIAYGSEEGPSMALTSPELSRFRNQSQKIAGNLFEKLRQSPDEHPSSNAGHRVASERIFLRMIMAAAECVFYFDSSCTLRCRHTANDRVNCRKLRKRACDAAHQASQLAQDVLGSQSPYFMPAWSLHFLLPPVSILILEAKSSHGEAHSLAVQRLTSLTGLLQTLGKRFTAVQRAVALLEAASKGAGGLLQTPGIPPRNIFSTPPGPPGPVTEDGRNSGQGRAIAGEHVSPDNFEWIRAASLAESPLRKAAGQDIDGLSSCYLFELEEGCDEEQLNAAGNTVFGSWSSHSSFDPYTQPCLQPTLKEFTAADDITSPWLGAWEDILQGQS